jgi:hypothetical protein
VEQSSSSSAHPLSFPAFRLLGETHGNCISVTVPNTSVVNVRLQMSWLGIASQQEHMSRLMLMPTETPFRIGTGGELL